MTSIPPVDRSQRQLSGGGPVTDDHRELKPNGQQKGYVVLSDAERAKGFVRPVRRSYVHVGGQGQRYPLRDLTAEERAQYAGGDFVKFEAYPASEAPRTGRFWTQARLDAAGKGCGTLTTMSQDIAETYARDPGFYGGTFCCGCGKHLPVAEFVWADTDSRVGS